jgi:hypothetical protein
MQTNIGTDPMQSINLFETILKLEFFYKIFLRLVNIFETSRFLELYKHFLKYRGPFFWSVPKFFFYYMNIFKARKHFRNLTISWFVWTYFKYHAQFFKPPKLNVWMVRTFWRLANIIKTSLFLDLFEHFLNLVDNFLNLPNYMFEWHKHLARTHRDIYNQ